MTTIVLEGITAEPYFDGYSIEATNVEKATLTLIFEAEDTSLYYEYFSNNSPDPTFPK